MPGKTARGRFVWHELMVPDTAQAHQFYSKVVGWKTQSFEQDPSYQMFTASSGPLGGTVARSEGASRWLPFIGTDDIEATVAEATTLGAKVVKPIAPIADGGRWAALLDPQGAEFAVYQASAAPAREKPPKRGEFSWHELMTTDYKGAFEFYSQLFGWETTSEADMGPPVGVYSMFGRNGIPMGGIYTAPPGMGAGPAWVGYVRVKDVHKAVKKATASGGTLINGPMEVPGGDWIAQLIDPQGAMFAVHALQADLQAPASPEGPQQGALDLAPSQASEPVSEPVATDETPPAKPAKKPTQARVAKAAPKKKRVPQKQAATKKKPKRAAKVAVKPKARKTPPVSKRGKKTRPRPAVRPAKKQARRPK